MNQRSFLILHGVENWRPREHWQWWLARELRSRGEHVFYPQLPNPSSPALDEWLAVLHGELAQLGSGERVVVAHSCGVALWLLAAPELAAEERVDRVALVAPPGPSAFFAPYRAFLPVGIDWAAVARASSQLPIVITSDNDPYCPEGIGAYRSTYTAPLDLRHELIPGVGHITIEDGFGPWSSMLDWCLSSSAFWNRAPSAH
jgi:predicted alpha/beta hydrolase family esterase